MIAVLTRWFYTIKYLKCTQIYHQIRFKLRKKFINDLRINRSYGRVKPILFKTFIHNPTSYKGNLTFEFLNIKHRFINKVDWNYIKNGKLWADNIGYFNFLHQKEISEEVYLEFIEDFVNSNSKLSIAVEPYNISIRNINWIKFLSKHKINDSSINQLLFNHFHILLKNLEYHLLGNHLLENGFSLLFGAYYFENEKFYSVAKKIINSELKEEILNDGAHFECSPMYHQITLFRLLDAIQLIQKNFRKQDKTFIDLLIRKAHLMLCWLQKVTFKNGEVPMVNDAAYGIAPKTKQLIEYGEYLGIYSGNVELLECGYRKIIKNNFELFLDVGNIQPAYQPGHSHADTFNFVMHYNLKPVIVDVGTSTYNKNDKRQLERSTKSHNTVTINNDNSSKVWGGFRVAQRAKVSLIKDEPFYILASHNGFKSSYNVLHKREFNFKTEHLIINDFVGNCEAVARLHFHPQIKTISIEKNKIHLVSENLSIEFISPKLAIALKDYDFCNGFNKTLKAKSAVICFQSKLTTKFVTNK